MISLTPQIAIIHDAFITRMHPQRTLVIFLHHFLRLFLILPIAVHTRLKTLTAN